MKPILLVVALTFISAAAIAQTSLAGTNWRFVEVAGVAVPADIRTNIEFEKDGVSGSSGCNTFFGDYAVAGSALSFKTMGWTKMFCGGPQMKFEIGIQTTLAATNTFQIVDRQLRFLAVDGSPLARLEQAPR